MNAKQLFAAALIFSATSAAFAQQVEANPAATGKTRAQVTTELQQAQADGSANGSSLLGLNNPVAAAAQPSNVITRGKTRAEVLAELQQAQENGTAMPTSLVAFDRPTTGTSRNASNSAVAGK
jgi:predicted RNase H-like HicB family nuclease